METTRQTQTTASTTLATAPAIVGTLESYRAYLAGQKKHRPRTIETYGKVILRFADWLGNEATVPGINADSIGRYLVQKPHLAPASVGKELSALRSYNRWCIRAKLRVDDPTLELEWPRRVEPLPRALATRELRTLDRLLSSPLPALNIKGRRREARDRRIVLIMLYAGLRLSEVAALLWKDVDLDEGTIVVRGKGGRDRVVPLHERLRANLEQTPEAQQRGAVCGHADGTPLSYKSIPHTFDRWLADHEIDISAHQLRHTFATRLLWEGRDIRVIQRLLGHKSLATTERYLAVEMTQKKAAVDSLPASW